MAVSLLEKKSNHQHHPAANPATYIGTYVQGMLVQWWHKRYGDNQPFSQIEFKAHSPR